MPETVKKYLVEVGELGKEEITSLTVALQSPDKELLDYLAVKLPQWLDAKEVPL